MDFEEKLLEQYVRDYDIAWYSYWMMGRLLDKKLVERRVELCRIESLYIYGGGFLGIQLHNALDGIVDIKAVVDKNGSLSVDVENIKVLSLDNLKKEYSGEKIIITPVKYYKAIWNDLSKFADKENLLFLGEFLEGIAS